MTGFFPKFFSLSEIFVSLSEIFVTLFTNLSDSVHQFGRLFWYIYLSLFRTFFYSVFSIFASLFKPT